MRTSTRIFLILALGLGCTSGSLAAADEADEAVAANLPGQEERATPIAPVNAFASLSPALDITFASRYLFQGLDFSEGRSVMQPNLSVSHRNFSAVVWSNYQPDLGDVNELDLSLKYTHERGPLSLSPGYTYLRYPNRDWDPTHEMFLDMGVSTPLNPTLSLHYDFDAGKGLYATLGFSHSFAIPVSLGANLFYQGNYYDMTGVPAAELKAGTSFSYGSFTLAPVLSRLLTTDNGDFRGPLATPSSWLLSVNVAPKH